MRVLRQARPPATRPSYYTRGALKTGGGAERPLPTRGAVAWTRGHVDASTAPFFSLFFLLDKSRKLSYDPHRSRDSMSPVCGIFLGAS